MNFRDFKAVIFDMDGVLIDSEPLWKIAMEDAFLSVGCKITRKDFQKTVGLRIDEVIEFWYNEIGWKGLSPKELEQRIVDKMVELIRENGKPLEGVVETLHYLRENNYKIGLGTSSYTVLIDVVLETIGLRSLFDFVHSAEHEEYGKPHPAVYLTVAKELGVKPTECMVVEDSINGVIAGKAAQMKVVCIPEKSHHPNPKLSLADNTFENMREMLNKLSK